MLVYGFSTRYFGAHLVCLEVVLTFSNVIMSHSVVVLGLSVLHHLDSYWCGSLAL